MPPRGATSRTLPPDPEADDELMNWEIVRLPPSERRAILPPNVVPDEVTVPATLILPAEAIPIESAAVELLVNTGVVETLPGVSNKTGKAPSPAVLNFKPELLLLIEMFAYPDGL